MLPEWIGVGLGIRDDAELDDVDADIGRKLDGERAQSGLHRALRGQVRDVVLERTRGARVPEPDHRAACFGEITRQRVNEQERRDGVDGERALEVLAAELVERGPRKRTARQNDVVDRAAPVDRRNRGAKTPNDVLDGVTMGEIGADERGRSAPGPRERGAELLELVRVTRREDDLVPAGGDRLRDGYPKAARCADHEYPSALAPRVRHSPGIAETTLRRGLERSAGLEVGRQRPPVHGRRCGRSQSRVEQVGMSEKGAAESPYLSHAEITQLWAKFRAGDVIACPRDSAGVALAVDGAAKAYRLVCTQCGLASPWFGTTPAGLVFRSPPATLSPGSPEG